MFLTKVAERARRDRTMTAKNKRRAVIFLRPIAPCERPSMEAFVCVTDEGHRALNDNMVNLLLNDK